MCIRDRESGEHGPGRSEVGRMRKKNTPVAGAVRRELYKSCLLYTSDAADERSSVDLGGRRIIKKKTTT